MAPVAGNRRAPHLKSLPEFVRQYVVEKRVDGGGEVVEDAADVRQDLEGADHAGGGVLAVDGEEALGVEGRPADEEGHHHGD